MKIVYKKTPEMNPREILCTTYQMRNPFRQFGDGVANELDTHCYFQHSYAASLLKKQGTVLDVCCGRGLLIPFLRYHADPSLYVGVDINRANVVWVSGQDPRDTKHNIDWGFRLVFIEANVDSMVKPIQTKLGDIKFDLIVYTSSIEHMQPESQKQSLEQTRALAKESTIMYLTCPITEGEVGTYNTQYDAHVYEPSVKELVEWLGNSGWFIGDYIGLCTKVGVYRECLEGTELHIADRVYTSMPREQALPTIANLFPKCATEMAYVCRTVKNAGLL